FPFLWKAFHKKGESYRMKNLNGSSRIKETDIHLHTFCTYWCHCYALFVAENYVVYSGLYYVFLIAKNSALLSTDYRLPNIYLRAFFSVVEGSGQKGIFGKIIEPC